MHAEMPRQNPDGSANVGMQLWVDLPEKLKKCEPRYRDLKASEIPNVDVDEGRVHIKVISGQSHGVDSVKELAYTPVWILDVEIKPGGKVQQTLPEGWNAFAYTLSGETVFGVGEEKKVVGQYHNVVFEQKGDSVSAEVAEGATENGHFSKSLSDFFLLIVSCTSRSVGPRLNFALTPLLEISKNLQVKNPISSPVTNNKRNKMSYQSRNSQIESIYKRRKRIDNAFFWKAKKKKNRKIFK